MKLIPAIELSGDDSPPARFKLLADDFEYRNVVLNGDAVLRVIKGQTVSVWYNPAKPVYVLRPDGSSRSYRVGGPAARKFMDDSKRLDKAKDIPIYRGAAAVKDNPLAKSGFKTAAATRWWNSLPDEGPGSKLEYNHGLIGLHHYFFQTPTTERFKLPAREAKNVVHGAIDDDDYIGAVSSMVNLRKFSKTYPISKLYRAQPVTKYKAANGLVQVTPIKDCTAFSLLPRIDVRLQTPVPTRGGTYVVLTITNPKSFVTVFDYRWAQDLVLANPDIPYFKQMAKILKRALKSFVLEQEIIVYTPKPFKARATRVDELD